VTIDDVLAATDYVTPAIEIIDARIEQFDRHTKVMRKVFDTISDNAANAGIVLGGRQGEAARRRPALGGAILLQNGAVEETGPGRGVQGHPASAWPGWPRSSRPGANAWRPARWCWAARSRGPPRRAGRHLRRRLRPARPIEFRFV
jgi:2-oxo-hept-3-ene-1,7-dioate hydratase